ncbi:DUF3087 domain-containing protein [Pseudomonas sp. CBS]|uniref:DUF3087 domain-containing protein n=1 Tax=Pseudomonas sp. CBS TaxID=2971912 RepID=UPI0021AC2940|nr:DUF3087 domain-containing protein [Pseudomonas sp. CBS]WEL65403.1 DUF3087 domain-containing protein [Pseudomonas sp. CBSPGW29]WEL68872.1 DUF3087 domain-containing protein [Pseudomonas sp. CBSPCGW29]WEL75884.1 DUF3087 domain-containing protein [Pseudomonas sp. CBSPAW29]WEL79879.1 DUF3087 domain-containing protein [Pseudomonas sp. CBSPCAW29]WEL88338.1 DUF3087 domain-containing protein [Pseudomonas sp. CBSPCBW29]
MFELKPCDPITFRQQTRRSTLIVAGLFVVLAMVLSSLAVMVFGEPGGDNFRFNVGGVFAGVLITLGLVRGPFWSQAWLAPAVYGWQLKRSLMSVTNVMHKVTDGVKANDPVAIKLLRFYHLGLMQMHELDANSSSQAQLVREVDEHLEKMRGLGIEPDQTRLDPGWVEAVKAR